MKNDKAHDQHPLSRRQFVKSAGIGAGLALAGGAAPALAKGALKTDTVCTLVPYFEVQEGKLDAFKALGPQFVKLTRKEAGVVHYAFSFSGQIAHCREGYVNAQGVLDHLKNVDAPLQEALKLAKIVRLEVHGPAAEIDKLREPLAGLKPQFFVLAEGGIRRA
jgi:quinol monooxygenase YgiN